jgi:hypothetical protein
LRYLKALTFFGKHDLTFGINLPERSEIWKTFLGPLMALTVNTPLAAMRTVRAPQGPPCLRIVFTPAALKTVERAPVPS